MADHPTGFSSQYYLMQMIFFLPSVAYGLALAIQGDLLLLVISVTSLLIWQLPRLSPEKEKAAEVVIESSHWPNPPAGRLISSDGTVFELPAYTKIELISLDLSGVKSEEFLSALLKACQEEFWLIGSYKNSDFMQQVATSDQGGKLIAFARAFRKRAEIPLPLNLVVTDMQAAFAKEELADLFREGDFSYRVLYLGSGQSGSKLNVEEQSGIYRVFGSVGGTGVEFFFLGLALASEKANDQSYEGLFTSGLFNDVRDPSGQHGTPSRDKPKWLNFPTRGAVVDESKRGEVRVFPKNQVSHRSSSKVGGSDAVADITTRLANLGHRIKPD